MYVTTVKNATVWKSKEWNMGGFREGKGKREIM